MTIPMNSHMTHNPHVARKATTTGRIRGLPDAYEEDASMRRRIDASVRRADEKNPAAGSTAAGFFVVSHRDEEKSVLGRPGSDLLFQALRLSTIGAGEFNGRVRDGIGFRLPAKATRSAKDGF